jgi:SAM-dependent methyltransferase
MDNLNKICTLSDWNEPELAAMMQQVYHPHYWVNNDWFSIKHRKHWEWAIGMLSLKKSGKLNGESIVLGIGSGTEFPVFYLSNFVKYVYCTDLYNISEKQWGEASPSMLIDPSKFAPHAFNRRRIGVQVMDGTSITFEDNTFDAVFSYSSIEHFGSRESIKKTMCEIERVLKPGGVASITTEIFIGNNYKHLEKERETDETSIVSEIFTKDELERYVINSTLLKTNSNIDYKVDKTDLDTVIDFPLSEEVYPHLFLKYHEIIWGSIHLQFIKS